MPAAPNSLAFRLTASAAVVSLVLLVAAGLLLNNLFNAALERNFDARLEAVLDVLLAGVELDEDNAPTFSGAFADNRFKVPLRGWCWQVRRLGGPADHVLTSESLLERRLEVPDEATLERDRAGIARYFMVDDNGNSLRVMEQRFTLFGSRDLFSFIVTGNFDELRTEVLAFRRALVIVLALLGFGLLAALLVQVRFGLRPLRRLQAELAAVRGGDADLLCERYPQEIQPVSDELNLLIQANAKIVERARTQVGNLAHALKTPLSVLTNEAAGGNTALAAKVREQTTVMRDQVNMYLDRARREARAQTRGTVADVGDVVDAISRTLQRIHSDRAVAVEVACDPAVRFRGERQDLEEMVGNLMENAFKWADRRIAVDVALHGSAQEAARQWLVIAVGDDGPGLPEGRRQQALKRGQRLDETKPGSGLGLAIVSETAEMYQGDLSLDRSDLGGLLARLRLPGLVVQAAA